MKKLLGIIVILLTVLGTNVNVEAKANLTALQNGSYTSLSYQDKCDTVVALVDVVKKDLGITSPIRTHFYNWPEGKAVAYAYYFPHDIYINMPMFDNDAEASTHGMTVEQYLVDVVAHEVRHVYQAEHENDDTDYGRACKTNNSNYIFYETNVGAYEVQFVERDADAYGLEFSNRYVKNKKASQKLIANDGKVFDPVFYANKYPDVKNVLGTDPQTLLNHYNTYGIKERRLPNGNYER